MPSLRPITEGTGLFGEGHTLSLFVFTWAAFQFSATVALFVTNDKFLNDPIYAWWPLVDLFRLALIVLIRITVSIGMLRGKDGTVEQNSALHQFLVVLNLVGLAMGSIGFIVYLVMVFLQPDPLATGSAEVMVLASAAVVAHFVLSLPALLKVYAPKAGEGAVAARANNDNRGNREAADVRGGGHAVGRASGGSFSAQRVFQEQADTDMQVALDVAARAEEDERRQAEALRRAEVEEQNQRFERAREEDEVQAAIRASLDDMDHPPVTPEEEPTNSDDEKESNGSDSVAITDRDAVSVKVRFPSGKTATTVLRESQAVTVLYKFVAAELKSQGERGNFQLVTAVPRKVYTKTKDTMRSVGITAKTKQFVLLVEMK